MHLDIFYAYLTSVILVGLLMITLFNSRFSLEFVRPKSKLVQRKQYQS